MNNEHIVMSGNSALCRICQETADFGIPILVDDFIRLGNEFVKKHENCQARRKKYQVTFPLAGFVSIEVEASTEKEATEMFFQKTDDLRMRGRITPMETTEIEWDFYHQLAEGSVRKYPIEELIITEKDAHTTRP